MKDIAVFKIGALYCGLDIKMIVEIAPVDRITPVHRSDAAIAGIINLRGEIVTVIDLRVKLATDRQNVHPEHKIVIVKYDGESLGLYVEGTDDIVSCDSKDVEKPPSHLEGVNIEYLSGVLKHPGKLILVLNPDTLLATDKKQDEKR